MLDVKVVVVSQDILPEKYSKMSESGISNFPFQTDKIPDRVLGATIDAQQLKRLIEAGDRNSNITLARRLTMMNGQRATVSLVGEDGKRGSIQVQGVVANDRSHVRLTATFNETLCTCLNVAVGKTLALDLTPTAESPVKNRQSPANPTNSPSLHRLLLVTPRVIIAEEEEEKLGIEPTDNTK